MCVAAGVQAVASPGSAQVSALGLASVDTGRRPEAPDLEPVRAARTEALARVSRATTRAPALSAAEELQEATRQAAQQAAAELARQAEAARIAAEQAAAAEAARKAAEEAARREAARKEAARQEAARQEAARREATNKATPAAPAAPEPQPKASGWIVPLQSYRITATFGQSGSNWSSTHTGLDLAAPTGTSVMAANSGTVVSAGGAGAYGNRLVIRHDDGTETWYCHLSAFTARAGQQVGAGEQIGKVGSTGNTTGPHLHLEVRVGGSPVDPRAFLAKRGAAP